MKTKLKDPRFKLILFFRAFLLLIIFIPFLYFNIKSSKLENIVFFVILYIISIFVIKIIYPAKKEVEKLNQIIPVSFAFSALISFFAFSLLFGTFIFDYLERSISPDIISLLLVFITLFMSYVLFYFSNKSRLYEKNVLHLRENINYKKLFYLYLICLFSFFVLLTFIRYVL